MYVEKILFVNGSKDQSQSFSLDIRQTKIRGHDPLQGISLTGSPTNQHKGEMSESELS
jgi:hypothetical protein